MLEKLIRRTALLIVIVFGLSLCLIDAEAQTRRKRSSRRVTKPIVTNPAIAPPNAEQSDSGGERIVSEAGETTEGNAGEATPENQNKPGTDQPLSRSEEENMQRTIKALSNQVNRLNDKLSQMQEDDRTLMEMERLSRAEQRAESLRSQQVEVESKLADLQSRLEQTDYWLKPENIERASAGFGSTRPEEARDARRRQLESEKSRLQAQIRILETSRTRLETAVATADAECDLLRRRLEQRRAQEEGVLPEPTPRSSTSRTRP